MIWGWPCRQSPHQVVVVSLEAHSFAWCSVSQLVLASVQG